MRHLQIAGWLAQLAAIAILLWFYSGRRTPSRQLHTRLPFTVCLLALAAAWAWRLAYEFVLSSIGYRYIVADDADRFLLSWAWYQQPYLVTWDGIWQGGTFYFNGAAMRLLHDPLAASRFVAVAFNLLALFGLLLFTEGVFRDRRLSILTVLFAAPWWVQVFLGSGTLPEMAVIAFLLGGVGIFLLGASAAPRRRLAAWWASAVCFAIATSFHMEAWMMLSAILLALLVYAWLSGPGEGAFRLTTWTWFSAVSISYCVAWLIGCWVKFGSPFEPMLRYKRYLLRDSGITRMSVRILTYPRELVHLLAALLPLVIFGILWSFFRRGEAISRARTVLTTMTLGLLVLVASAASANPGGLPYRAVTPLAAALLPFALAPLVTLLPSPRSGSVGWTRMQAGSTAAVALIAICWTWYNHDRVLNFPRQVQDVDPDAAATGTWLRSEIEFPGLLHLGPGSPPIRLWPSDYMKALTILYTCGLMNQMQWRQDATSPGIESMRDGQYLLTDRNVDDPRLKLRTQIAKFSLYQLEEAPATPATSPAGSLTYEFRDGTFDPSSVKGFYSAESWGMWSQAETAELKLPHPVKGSFQFVITAQSLESARNNRLSVTFGAQSRQVVLEHRASTQTLDFTLRAPTDTIVFRGIHPVSPASLGINRDPRPLGFGLARLELIPKE